MRKFSSLGSLNDHAQQAAETISGLLSKARETSLNPSLPFSKFTEEAKKQLSDTIETTKLKSRISTRLRSLNVFFTNPNIEKNLSQLTDWQPIWDVFKPIVVFYQTNNFDIEIISVDLGSYLSQKNPAQVADLKGFDMFIHDFIGVLQTQLIPNILDNYALSKEQLEAKIDHLDAPHFANWLAEQPVKSSVATLVIQKNSLNNIANDADFINALGFLDPPQERVQQEEAFTEQHVTYQPIIAIPVTSHAIDCPHYLIAGAGFYWVTSVSY